MRIHHRLAKAFGHDLIKRKKHPSANAHTINLIRHYDIDLVLDVGANRGQFGSLLREVGYKGEIHSFEPISHVFESLRQRSDDDQNWHAHQLGLGAERGRETVHVSEASDLSSLLKPNEFGQENFSAIRAEREETVEIDTVDNFLATKIPEFDKRRIFLKMDTQGYDLQVFAGATESLPSVICLLSEISLIPIYAGMPYYLDSLRRYEESGFVVTGLYPISRTESFAVIEIDCMMINNKRLTQSGPV